MGTIQVWIPDAEMHEMENMLRELVNYWEEKTNRSFGDKTFRWEYSGKERHMVKRFRVTPSFAIRQAIYLHWKEIQQQKEAEKQEIERTETEVYKVSGPEKKETRPWVLKKKESTDFPWKKK